MAGKIYPSMSSRPPLAGYNHNVNYRNRRYHVQTEDSGTDNPRLDTHLFHGGMIIDSAKTDYSDELEKPDSRVTVKNMMQDQHKRLMKRLIHGALDDKIVELLGCLDPEEQFASLELQPGLYLVSATPPPDSLYGTAILAMVVNPGDDTETAVRCRRKRLLHGIVWAPDGEPVPGARVVDRLRFDFGELAGVSVERSWATITDLSGTAALLADGGDPPVEHELTVYPPAGSLLPVEIFNERVPFPTSNADTPLAIDLGLPSPFLRTFEVTGADGEPAEKATVRLTWLGGADGTRLMQAEGVTDDNGEIVLPLPGRD